MRPILILTAALAIASPVRASEADAEASAHAFRIADANGDNALTLPEFTLFMQILADAGESSARFVRTFGVYRLAFRQVDANGDGIATMDELLVARGDVPGRD